MGRADGNVEGQQQTKEEAKGPVLVKQKIA